LSIRIERTNLETVFGGVEATANTAERNPTAAMAVLEAACAEIFHHHFGGVGSASNAV
jgi:hypothetical protein